MMGANRYQRLSYRDLRVADVPQEGVCQDSSRKEADALRRTLVFTRGVLNTCFNFASQTVTRSMLLHKLS